MNSSRRRWIPALATMLLLLDISLAIIVLWFGLHDPVDPIPTSDLVFVSLLLAFPIVGLLIAVRRPQNPLGWIFLASMLILGIGAASDELVLRAARVGSDATAAKLLMVGGWIQFLGYWLLIGLAILLFPDGRVPSNRFRWALWGLATLVLVWGVIYAIGTEMVCVVRFGGTSDPCVHSVENPLEVFTDAGLVVTVLAVAYVVSVTLTQRILPVQNQFGIVVSTLVAATLFNPLRRRVQNAVDRRFNRSQYNARRVLDEFSNQLRDVVDLEQMQVALLSATQETMQPSHLSLWIRERELENR